MKRSEFELSLRAAADVIDSTDIIVVGSQAIHGAIPDLETRAPELCASREIDIFVRNRPDLNNKIDTELGEKTAFHAAHNFYVDAIDETIPTLPNGWQHRLIKIDPSDAKGLHGYCVDPGDVAISKLNAGRDKDYTFVDAMLEHGLTTVAVLQERLDDTRMDPKKKVVLSQWLGERRPASNSQKQ